MEGAKSKRLLTGLILSLVVVICLALGGIPTMLFLATVIFIASREYVTILKNKGFFPSLTLILIADAAFAFFIFLHRFDLLPLIITIAIISAFLVILFRGRQPYIANVATTMLGFMYGGWLPCHLILLRQLGQDNIGFFKFWHNEGLGFVMFLILTVITTDVAAYFFGSKFGKTKLSPVISPKKTVEGALCGAFCAVIVAFITGHFIGLLWYQSLFAGILITIFAQLGDLAESLIKRDAGVKDSGDTLPGHGGFLDRADSFIFATPVAFYYFKYFVSSNDLFVDFVKFANGVFNAYF